MVVRNLYALKLNMKITQTDNHIVFRVDNEIDLALAIKRAGDD